MRGHRPSTDAYILHKIVNHRLFYPNFNDAATSYSPRAICASLSVSIYKLRGYISLGRPDQRRSPNIRALQFMEFMAWFIAFHELYDHFFFF